MVNKSNFLEGIQNCQLTFVIFFIKVVVVMRGLDFATGIIS